MGHFNVEKIRQSFNGVQEEYAEINSRLKIKRDDFKDEVKENILLAYSYLNELLLQGVDLFNPAGQYSMLELNHIVLCGNNAQKRAEYHQHIRSTRVRFQETIKDIMLWYNKIKEEDPYDIAVEFYMRALSQPQLFFEGNHRTENIILNYILAGYDKPVFIINKDNAYDYFEISAEIKHSKRESISSLFSFRSIKKNIKNILVEQGNSDFLSK